MFTSLLFTQISSLDLLTSTYILTQVHDDVTIFIMERVSQVLPIFMITFTTSFLKNYQYIEMISQE